MKSCAVCGGSYDDTVAFCLVDGTRLADAAEAASSTSHERAAPGGTVVRLPISKRTLAIAFVVLLLAAIWHFGVFGAPSDSTQRVAQALVEANRAEARAVRSLDAAALEPAFTGQALEKGRTAVAELVARRVYLDEQFSGLNIGHIAARNAGDGFEAIVTESADITIFSDDTHIALGRKQLSHKQHVVLLAENGALRVASFEDVP